MASLQQDRGGWRLQFYFPTGKRRSVYLGRMDDSEAQACKQHVEELIRASKSVGVTDSETIKWLHEVPRELYAKLAGCGLCLTRRYSGKAATHLGEYLNSYIEDRDGTEWKPSSTRNYRNSCDWVLQFFGADRKLVDISIDDVSQWRVWMEAGDPSEGRKPLAESTAAKHHKRAREMLSAALADQLIAENPFRSKILIRVDAAKQFYVSRDVTQRIIDASGDISWKLILACCRYGGLRCPSEVLSLAWSDIHWSAERLQVRRLGDRSERFVPLFPRLRNLLQAAREFAPPRSQYVVRRYRDTEANLRNQLQRIIRLAGEKPWPKPFVNLRASCRTDLEEVFPRAICDEWLGRGSSVMKDNADEWVRATRVDDFAPKIVRAS